MPDWRSSCQSRPLSHTKFRSHQSRDDCGARTGQGAGQSPGNGSTERCNCARRPGLRSSTGRSSADACARCWRCDSHHRLGERLHDILRCARSTSNDWPVAVQRRVCLVVGAKLLHVRNFSVHELQNFSARTRTCTQQGRAGNGAEFLRPLCAQVELQMVRTDDTRMHTPTQPHGSPASIARHLLRTNPGMRDHD